jgi:hypothetical protein
LEVFAMPAKMADGSAVVFVGYPRGGISVQSALLRCCVGGELFEERHLGSEGALLISSVPLKQPVILDGVGLRHSGAEQVLAMLSRGGRTRVHVINLVVDRPTTANRLWGWSPAEVDALWDQFHTGVYSTIGVYASHRLMHSVDGRGTYREVEIQVHHALRHELRFS